MQNFPFLKIIFSRERLKKILIGIGVAAILIASFIIIKDEIWYQLSPDSYSSEGEQTSFCYEDDNIALVKINGGIGNYKLNPADDPDGKQDPDSVSSEVVATYLEEIEADDQIKGIIVEIDSFGGVPSAAEEIMNPLKKSSKPVVAVIRDRGLSAAYLVATGADRIYASKFSNVGGIGVTMSYLDYSQKNRNEGLVYQQISSGKFKDTGDPDKSLSAEEKELLMRDTKKMHQIFIDDVAQNRSMDIKAVEKLADGSSMLGEDAKAAGLIDEIGDLSSAKDWLRAQLGIEPAVCVYE